MRILATAAFAFAAGVFSTQVLPEGGWLPLGLAALAAALMLSRHLDGLDRIRRGQEKKFRLSKNQP